jgi:type II secretory pathway component PulF
VLAALEQADDAGLPLSSAMAAMPRAFPPLLVQVVRTGETTGDLGAMMQRTVESMELEAAMRGKLRSALLYPAVMLTLTIGVVAFLIGFVVPKFQRIFAGKTLPMPTRVLLALGELARDYGLYALGGLVAAIVAAVIYVRTQHGRRSVDRLLLRTPLVGGLYRLSVLGRCVRTLGFMLQAGVPVHVALEHTQEVAGSGTFAGIWRNARIGVTNGGALLDTVRNNRHLGPAFEQLVAAGESTATLDRVMLKAANQYSKDLERRLRDMLTLLEPAMVVVMGCVVAWVALSIMLPIFQMSRR